MRIRDLMTTDVATVKPDTPVKDAARQMSKLGISGLPVVDDDNRVVGVLSEADFLGRAGSGERPSILDLLLNRDVGQSLPSNVSGVMKDKVVTITADQPHSAAAVLMQKKKVKRLPVVDEHGRLEGIVSRSDLLRIYTRSDAEIHREILERVVGEVIDPHSFELEIEVVNGRVRLAGTMATKTEARLLEQLSGAVDGVLSVDSSLHFRVDDSNPDLTPFGPVPRGW